MADNNVTIDAHPDRAAEELWHGVAKASDKIGDLIGDIPAAGVQSEETRNELR